MNISDGIKTLIQKTGVKQKDLAESMGYKSPAIISNAISRENLTLDLLIRMCNTLNYEVVVRPKVIKGTDADIVFDIPKNDGIRSQGE